MSSYTYPVSKINYYPGVKTYDNFRRDLRRSFPIYVNVRNFKDARQLKAFCYAAHVERVRAYLGGYSMDKFAINSRSKIVQNYMRDNVMSGYNIMKTFEFEDIIIDELPYLEEERVSSILDIQFFVNYLYPLWDKCLWASRYDGYQMYMSTKDYYVDDVNFRFLFQPYKDVDVNINPLLLTPYPAIQQSDIFNMLHSIEARNHNVPEIEQEHDRNKVLYDSIRQLFRATMLVTVDEYALIHMNDVIHVAPPDFVTWTATQHSEKVRNLAELEKLVYVALDKYEMMLKRVPKVKSDIGSVGKYQALQTIVHNKEMNPVFRTVLAEVQRRLHLHLKPNILINTKKSIRDLQRFMNKYIDRDLDQLQILEIDISKFDKSQNYDSLMFELIIFVLSGVPDWMCEMWYHAHLLKFVKTRAGISLTIPLQRTSGDPWTFDGNTFESMRAIYTTLNIYAPSVVSSGQLLAALHAGDDSLIIFSRDALHADDLQKIDNDMGRLFNFETKTPRVERSMYFCSKYFLWDVQGRRQWLCVPDPVKIALKLGRTDLRNVWHMEEYRRSLMDLVCNYNVSTIGLLLADAVAERFQVEMYDLTTLVSAIYQHVNDIQLFFELFEVLSSDPGQQGARDDGAQPKVAHMLRIGMSQYELHTYCYVVLVEDNVSLTRSYILSLRLPNVIWLQVKPSARTTIQTYVNEMRDGVIFTDSYELYNSVSKIRRIRMKDHVKTAYIVDISTIIQVDQPQTFLGAHHYYVVMPMAHGKTYYATRYPNILLDVDDIQLLLSTNEQVLLKRALSLACENDDFREYNTTYFKYMSEMYATLSESYTNRILLVHSDEIAEILGRSCRIAACVMREFDMVQENMVKRCDSRFHLARLNWEEVYGSATNKFNSNSHLAGYISELVKEFSNNKM